ncbi:hypothetical protein C7H84_32445 [Burkholderia sp. Nafp2/4-1b]|uniref:hypothetical protein n=1 Tax=Burkholderia sp. Nafp2/4-1b TaxID=2116686 RepID=UPI000EF93CC4|nr:hypothetical protein [Burkholderia sp. Nafp2/4-1b]RKT99232.1 hypothetical protein C7H84_32445 [Burkholderia sp. Nafp2/4-1b]
MVKTLAVCAALSIAAVAFPRFHEASADGNAPAHALATDAGRVDTRHATVAEPVAVPGLAPSSNDGNAGLRAAAAQGADKPPIAALGVAHAGWSDLFNH